MKGLMGILACGLLAVSAAAQEAAAPIHPSAVLVRPQIPRDPTTQTACLAVARAFDYGAVVGDLIEVDYLYLDAAGCEPDVQATVTDGGAVVASPLGRLPIDEAAPGFAATGFFYQAVQPGSDTVTLTADGQTYSYQFDVTSASADRGDGGTPICRAADPVPALLLRPWMAEVKNCYAVPAAATFTASVGDLIEMDCYEVVAPGCSGKPRIKLSGDGAVAPSSLGFRWIWEGTGGADRYACFFQAVQPGKAKITFTMKGKSYHYVIEVTAAQRAARP